ncbi:hypothetical protein [Lysobacter gummosus]
MKTARAMGARLSATSAALRALAAVRKPCCRATRLRLAPARTTNQPTSGM